VENEVRLYRILDVQMTRNLGQKMFGLGSINVHSSDASLKDFTIKKSTYKRKLFCRYQKL